MCLVLCSKKVSSVNKKASQAVSRNPLNFTHHLLIRKFCVYYRNYQLIFEQSLNITSSNWGITLFNFFYSLLLALEKHVSHVNSHFLFFSSIGHKECCQSEHQWCWCWLLCFSWVFAPSSSCITLGIVENKGEFGEFFLRGF